MSTALIQAITAIALALAFYTAGVWEEHKDKVLKPIHLVLLWLGFCADSIGTGLMSALTAESETVLSNLQSITGIIAILILMVHAMWATAILVLHDEESYVNFRLYSMKVWRVWLVPFALSLIFGLVA